MSVIIPTYNHGDLIERSIGSVLDQTYEPVELIIVDDASTDDTAETIAGYQERGDVRIITHYDNRGQASAINSGLSIVEGEYVAFLDADDEWTSDKLKKQIQYMLEHDFRAVYSGVTRTKDDTVLPLQRLVSHLSALTDEGDTRKEGGEELIKRVLNVELGLGGTSTLVVSTDLMHELSGFDPRFSRHTDWEFVVRLLKKADLGYVDEPLVIKYHTGSPPVAKIEQAQQLFLQKFSKDIEKYTKEGVPIENTHRFRLAEKHFFKGEFLRGLLRLREVTLSRQMVLKLSWATVRGCRVKLTGRTS